MSNKKNLFRAHSGKEEEAVSVFDNRDVFTLGNKEPNNDILIVCDNASADLK